MYIADILTPATIMLDVHATCVKQLLLKASEVLSATCQCNARTIFEALQERERLGSTSMGNGVAIPHARLPHLTQHHAAFLRSANPFTFDADEDKKSQLFFVILAPSEDSSNHLKLLASTVKMLKTPAMLDAIQQAPDHFQLHRLLQDYARN